MSSFDGQCVWLQFHRNSLTENLDFHQISWINGNVSSSKIDSSSVSGKYIYTNLGSFTRDFEYHAMASKDRSRSGLECVESQNYRAGSSVNHT